MQLGFKHAKTSLAQVKKYQAYLAQAKSDFKVFELLQGDDTVENCHAVHYLQMATEKLSKAVICVQIGSSKKTHIAFSKLFTYLDNKLYADQLGYAGKFAAYRSFVKSIARLLWR
jgi:hypothetical protein